MFARKRLVVGGLVVVLLAVGGYAYAGTRGDATSYRTVAASTGTVQRTLSVTGNVAASGRRDLAFGASGTVRKVPVRLGERVRKGQVLARLDSTDLRADVIAARATLAKARAQLVSDESSSSSSSSSSSGSSGSSSGKGSGVAKSGAKGGTGGTAPGSGSPGSTGSSGSTGGTGSTGSTGSTGGGPGTATSTPGTAPTLDDNAVNTAEATLTAKTGLLTAALNDYVDFVESTCTTADTTQAGQACDSGAPAASCADPASKPATLAGAKGCVAAAQADVASAASAVSTAATAAVTSYLTAVKKYAAALVRAGKAAGKAAGETAAAGIIAQAQVQADQMIAQAQKMASMGSKNATANPTAAQGGSSSSEKQLASDRAAIASAQASLVSAKQSAKAATLRAPIAGKVVDVAVAKGDAASTSTTAVTVLGSGRTTVEATVTLAQVPNVKKGQAVSVVPAGWSETLRGRITQVGLVATTSTSGSTTYPITVTIRRAPSIPLGTTAALSIVTGSAKDAVTVPTSAVSRSSRGDTVIVLENGKATTTRVSVGLIGTSKTTIKAGLKAGQEVVIADLDATLPSDDSSSRRSNGLGGLGGGSGPVMVRMAPGGR